MSTPRSRGAVVVAAGLSLATVLVTACAVLVLRDGARWRATTPATTTSRSAAEEQPQQPRAGTRRPTRARTGGGRTARVFPVAGCRASYGRTHHDYPATDIVAPRGCLFVSPVAGRVDEVQRSDSWQPDTNLGADRGGLTVSVVGVDGVRYYGSHLERVLPTTRPGRVVRAGTALGRIGDTGSARGVTPHVHFGLSWPTPAGRWWIRRGTVAPTPFLDAWRSGKPLSPAEAVRVARADHGDDTRCRAYC